MYWSENEQSGGRSLLQGRVNWNGASHVYWSEANSQVAVLSVPHNSLLLGSSFSDADLLEVTLIKILQQMQDVQMR